MKNMASITGWSFLIIAFLLTVQPSFSLFNFKCLEKGDAAPALPDAYSTNIRINFLLRQYTMEVKYATIGETNQELIEIKSEKKHAKYITTGNETALYIEYKEDEHPRCTVTKSKKILNLLDEEFLGKNKIFLKAAEVMMFPNDFDLYSAMPYSDTGVISRRYEGCLTEQNINVSIAFAVDSWNQSHVSSVVKDVKYPVMALAEIDNVHMMALYSNFDPTTPDDAVFQPPEDVYCEGYRANKKPPKMRDFFSYNAEIIVYESALGLAPIISYRQMYYDYSSRISRMDSYDPIADGSDLFSSMRSQRKSIIHDYNAGAQYIMNPYTGKCTIDDFQATFSVISFEETKNNKMLNGDEYFWLDNTKTSYNGQYLVNGKIADVYTAVKIDPKTNENVVISWAFSTEKTRVVGTEKMKEKNVLLRMYVRPETDMGYEGVTQISFYNFINDQPDVFTYDITSCFNETSSKTLVLTFPGHDSLKDFSRLVGLLTHMALVNALEIRKQRIYLREVVYSGKYMYAEFTVLEDSPLKGKEGSKEISVDEALNKLRKAISKGSFTVDVPISNKETVTLLPEPDGLNVFAGDRKMKPSVVGYKEGSVISLTIGMLLLGFLLGGVTLNLVMSKKFGVSLFQRSRPGDEYFNNPLNESSM